jgi:hypothetical protein
MHIHMAHGPDGRPDDSPSMALRNQFKPKIEKGRKLQRPAKPEPLRRRKIRRRPY